MPALPTRLRVRTFSISAFSLGCIAPFQAQQGHVQVTPVAGLEGFRRDAVVEVSLRSWKAATMPARVTTLALVVADERVGDGRLQRRPSSPARRSSAAAH